VERIVAAWGANLGPVRDRPDAIMRLLDGPDFPRTVALGLTQAGEPRHPLYVKGDVEPIEYPPGRRGVPR